MSVFRTDDPCQDRMTHCQLISCRASAPSTPWTGVDFRTQRQLWRRAALPGLARPSLQKRLATQVVAGVRPQRRRAHRSTNGSFSHPDRFM